MKTASLLSSALLFEILCLRQVLANSVSECRTVTVETEGDVDGSFTYSALQDSVSQGRPVFFSDANTEAPYLAFVSTDVALPSSDNNTVGYANCTNVWALITSLESSAESSSSLYAENCLALHPVDITGPWYTYSPSDTDNVSSGEDSSKQVLIECAEDEASSQAADECAVATTYSAYQNYFTYSRCYSLWDSNVGFEFTITPNQGDLVSIIISGNALTCGLTQDFDDMDYIEEYSRLTPSDEEFSVSVAVSDKEFYTEAVEYFCVVIYCDSLSSSNSGYYCEGSIVGGWDFDGDEKAASTFWTWVGCIIGAIVLSIIICSYFCCCRKRTVVIDKGMVVPGQAVQMLQPQVQPQMMAAGTPQMSPQQFQQGNVYAPQQPQPGMVYAAQQPQPGMVITPQG